MEISLSHGYDLYRMCRSPMCGPLTKCTLEPTPPKFRVMVKNCILLGEIVCIYIILFPGTHWTPSLPEAHGSFQKPTFGYMPGRTQIWPTLLFLVYFLMCLFLLYSWQHWFIILPERHLFRWLLLPWQFQIPKKRNSNSCTNNHKEIRNFQ